MKKIIVIILLLFVLILPKSVYAEQSEKRIDLELGLSSISSDRLDGYDTGKKLWAKIYADEQDRNLNFEVGKAFVTSDLSDDLESGLDFGVSFTFMKADNWGWDFALNFTTFDVKENQYLKGSIRSVSFLACIKYHFISKPNSFSPYFRLGAGVVIEYEDLDLYDQGEKIDLNADEAML